jgi:hypothetical protein
MRAIFNALGATIIGVGVLIAVGASVAGSALYLALPSIVFLFVWNRWLAAALGLSPITSNGWAFAFIAFTSIVTANLRANEPGSK